MDENTDFQKLQSVGINISTMKKGDFYTQAQVIDAYHLLDPKLPEKIAAYERGERGDPRSFACQQVKSRIEKIREELGLENLVMNCPNAGLRVLTDEESVPYLQGQANAGLKKHRNKTHFTEEREHFEQQEHLLQHYCTHNIQTTAETPARFFILVFPT